MTNWREKKLLSLIEQNESSLKSQQRHLEASLRDVKKTREAYEWLLRQLKKSSSTIKKKYKDVISEISQRQLHVLFTDLQFSESELARIMRGITEVNTKLLLHKSELFKLKRRSR